MATKKNNPFLLDISWAAGQAQGTSRDVEFNFPSLHFEPDLAIRDLNGKVTTIVSEDGVMIRGRLTAETELECTRCLDVFPHQLEISFAEMYVFSRSQDEVNELEERRLPPDGYIDLEPLFREYALLDIPIKHICSPECKGLCPVCGGNLNKEDCGHRQEKIDPRMAVLKQLLDDEE